MNKDLSPKSDAADKAVPSAVSMRTRVLIFFIALLAMAFGLRSCFIASGDYHNSAALTIEFVGAMRNADGEYIFTTMPAFELTPIPVRQRPVFVEILTDEKYQRKSKESYVGGWGEHQGSWGGLVVDANYVGDKLTVELSSEGLGSGKYWIRSAIYARATYSYKMSQFDILLSGAIAKPINYKDGYYYLNKDGVNLAYFASRYYSFYIQDSKSNP